MHKVLFSTKCWEGDYEELSTYEFDTKIYLCNYNFDATAIIINNVSNDKYVSELFYVKSDIIVRVDEIADKVLKYFNIDKESFGYGYRYSICELAEIYLASGYDYLVHFASDVRMKFLGDWITPGIEILEKNKDILVVSPSHSQDNLVENTTTTWFSDQCYLIRVEDFRKPNIYNYEFPVENQYPDYGGNSFERRAGRYMINEGKKRLWLKDFATIHPTVGSNAIK